MEALLPSRTISAYSGDRQGLSEAANDAVIKLISSDDPWLHHFEDPSSKNLIEGCEFKGEDCEASVLSKALFYYLLNIAREIGTISDRPSTNKPFSLLEPSSPEKCFCEKGEATYPKDLRFHFDVMNTPNAFDGYKFNSAWRIGVMAMKNDVALRFPSIRYTIGNFAPLPWWITRTYYSNGLQGLHNGMSEWWDMLLLYLQWRMDEFKDEKMSFVDYIIFTCQFFYIFSLAEIDDTAAETSNGGLSRKELFRRLFEGEYTEEDGSKREFTADDFCNELTTDEKGRTRWAEHVKAWSVALRKNADNLKVLSLMSVDSESKVLVLPDCLKDADLQEKSSELFIDNYWKEEGHGLRDPKKVTLEEIHQTDKLISRLIEVRGRCIMGLLEGI